MSAAEHLCRRYTDVTRLRHQVGLVDEPRGRLTRDPHDHGDVVGQFGAVGLVHPSTREGNETLDVAAAD